MVVALYGQYVTLAPWELDYDCLMQPLPRDFLVRMARKYALSSEQEEVFVALFSRETNEQAVAEALHLSRNELRNHLREIYARFSIRDTGLGKFRKLHDFLLLTDQQGNPMNATIDSQQGLKYYDFRGAQFSGGFAETVYGNQVGGTIDNSGSVDFAADINALVQDMRQKVHDDIKERCSVTRVLDMTQPIELGDIYTQVNILKKITGRQRKEVVELRKESEPKSSTRFTLGKIQQEQVSGLEAVEHHSKLLVFGKPGAGKTTFLKQLATLCNLDEFQPHRVPIFIPLKDFAEASGKTTLLAYINRQWSACGVQGTEVAVPLMTQGRVLILLDGLDEVRETDHDRVLKEVKTFTDQFWTCQYVMTCRIAGEEYTFEQFTEVEIADFNDDQIAQFAVKWFKAKKNTGKAEIFIAKLKDNPPIQELATNPLLLTLLCLVFEEAADFSRNRSELYQEGLNVLLKKWDAKRNIKRGQLYKQLSLKRKEGLLSQIAFDMFEQENYFFKQNTVEAQITHYIQNLPNAEIDPEALQLDGEAVLKSVEAQHGLLVERARGIYSFSHLSFQEYFTARQIANTPSTKVMEAMKDLSSHIIDKRWREVFLLTVEMLSNADYLLEAMKAEIDNLLAGDKQLQKFLEWGRQKAISVEVTCIPAAIRAIYLHCALSGHTKLSISPDFDLDRALFRALFAALCLDNDIGYDYESSLDPIVARVLSRAFDSNSDLDRNLELDIPKIFNHSFVTRCLNLFQSRPRPLSRSRSRPFLKESTFNLSFRLSLDRVHELAYSLDCALVRPPFHLANFNFNSSFNLSFVNDLFLSHDLASDCALRQALQNLKAQLPDEMSNSELLRQWWKANGDNWTEGLCNVMIEHRNIGYDWQLSVEQLEKLGQYYEATQLLVDCLNSDCSVTRSVRKKIEDTLLLPVAT